MRTAVLIPVKERFGAKTRLARWLTKRERAELVRNMLSDVAAAVDGSELTEHIFLLTSDDWALDFGRKRRWRLVAEPAQVSESHSVDRALRRLRRAGFEAVLRLPADIPLIRADDVNQLLEAPVSPPGAVLAPSREGTGTNALLRTPPDVFKSSFGPDSFRLHRLAAARRGVQLTVVNNPRLALDIDTAEDILELDSRGDSGTLDFLRSRGIIERIQTRRPLHAVT